MGALVARPRGRTTTSVDPHLMFVMALRLRTSTPLPPTKRAEKRVNLETNQTPV